MLWMQLGAVTMHIASVTAQPHQAVACLQQPGYCVIGCRLQPCLHLSSATIQLLEPHRFMAFLVHMQPTLHLMPSRSAEIQLSCSNAPPRQRLQSRQPISSPMQRPRAPLPQPLHLSLPAHPLPSRPSLPSQPSPRDPGPKKPPRSWEPSPAQLSRCAVLRGAMAYHLFCAGLPDWGECLLALDSSQSSQYWILQRGILLLACTDVAACWPSCKGALIM